MFLVYYSETLIHIQNISLSISCETFIYSNNVSSSIPAKPLPIVTMFPHLFPVKR